MTWILSGFADEAGESLDEQIAALVEGKVDHIDLRNIDGYNIVDLPLAHAEKIRRKLDDAGIRVCMYGSPIGKIDIADDFQIDVKRIAHLGRLRPIFGATAVRMFSYFNKAKAPDERWREEAMGRVKRLVELAEEQELVLFHEHEPGLYGGSYEHVCDLRDHVHAPHPDRFKLIFDFDNFNQAGEDVWSCYEGLREDVHAVHLKESARQKDGTFMHVPVGTGDGRVPEILGDLAQRGWSGSLTLEPHLARSSAVLKTGPHGEANASLSDLSPHECFVVAAQAARELLDNLGKLPVGV